jgi:radical SAM superfamily enzyme YgiQ (UPF0313 family)
MSQPTKRLVLAYPPFSTPLSPPLGVTTLKGYLNRALPAWSSRVVDLSLLYHEKIFQAVRQKSSPLLQGNPLPGIPLPPEAEAFFRGGDEHEFYHQPDRHLEYTNLVVDFFAANSWLLVKRLEAVYRNDEPMPVVFEELADALLADDPDAVGISVCYNEQFWVGICLARIVKERTSRPVIFGGTFFLNDPEQLILDFGDVIDFIVTGDGERALARLLERPERPEDVPGLCWSSGGTARSNVPAFERKLDTLGHPDFSDLDLKRYYSPAPVLPLMTGRGCFWRRCTFCTHYKSYGLTYRLNGIPHVIEELEHHAAAGVTHFSFVDEMIPANRFKQLAQAILKAGLDIRYSAMARPTGDFDRECLERMYESGCRFVMWGFESGNQRVLDLIEKGTVLEDIRRVLRESAEAGLFNHLFTIFGYPTETWEEARDTLRFLDENRRVVHHVHRSIFGLERGSPIFDDPDRFAVTNMWPSGGYPYQNTFEFECSEGMQRDEVRQLVKEATPFLRAFNPYANTLGKFREHAVLIYSKLGKELDVEGRQFPPYPTEAPSIEGPAQPEEPRMGRRIDHSLRVSSMKWWTVLLGILLVVPLLGYLVLRRVHVFKVRRNRRRHPDYAVKEFPDFLTELECEHLIKAAASRIQGGSADGDKSWMSQVQQSSMTFLQTDATIARIKQKLARLSGTPLDQQEKIQVTRYDRFEYYAPHFDSLGGSRQAQRGPGNRVCTVLIYLNENYEGGSTFFPDFGLRITPERGKAVFFHNLTAEGDAQHPMARHVGEPVLSGEKWVCNQWIRQGTVARPPAAKASTLPARSSGRRSRPHPRRRARARPRKSKRKR